jgi:hypothetical protein
LKVISNLPPKKSSDLKIEFFAGVVVFGIFYIVSVFILG